MRKLLVLACVAIALPLNAAESKPIFQIGHIDGSAREFGLIKATYKGYAQRYKKPVVFTVGKSSLDDWPHIHPTAKDTWAGSKDHPFTIRFSLDQVPRGPLSLSLGIVAAHSPASVVTVEINGHALPTQKTPAGSAALAKNPAGKATTIASMVFTVPARRLVKGENTIAITLRKDGWVIYDFVCLTKEPRRYEVPITPRKPPAKDISKDALKGPLNDVEEVVFAARINGPDGHWYANFSYYAEDEKRLTYVDGAKLCVLNIHTGKRRVLIDDPKGGVRDPQVHYDGHKILFSYRRDGSKHYHLYEMNADGTNLRQLTDGPWDDLEPTYLPDGGIAFVSSRCKRWVNCWLTQVATIHRCDADGSNIRALSSNNEHDNTPWVLPDGRLLYQRWEYVDRSQVHYHHLWTMNPDGSGQTVYYGNLNPGIVMIDAKPIPGKTTVLSIFSPKHGAREHAGQVTIVDPSMGPDDLKSARSFGPSGSRDPYPITPDCFLVARGATLLVMNSRGQTGQLYSLPREEMSQKMELHEPRPLRPRPRERDIASRIDTKSKTGRYIVADVYEGRRMTGVKRGEIKKLLILETLPKPINFTGGMEPLSFGGTFTLERVVGEVPVEADGSASFEAPATRSLIFVALDRNDLAVKRMQSFTTVMPGETLACVGCHEQRVKTPVPTGTRALMALRRAPSKITPIDGVPDVYDFPRDIQPILDRHCLDCHDYEATENGGPRSGGVILSGDRGPLYSHSYYMLTSRGQFSDGRNRPKSNYAPRALGSSASPILKKLGGGHHDVKVSEREKTIVRLWIETGAPYPGTYAGLGSGMIGGYAQNKIDRSDLQGEGVKAAQAVLKQSCGKCHKGKMALPDSPSDNRGTAPWKAPHATPQMSRHIVYNLTRPELSTLLLAPLAKEAGGLDLCRAKAKKDGKQTPAPITSKDDPNYQTLLASIVEVKARLDEIKRFDMPGFQPRAAYLREMKRYGLLPDDLPDDAKVDPYRVDREYWKSLWWEPIADSGE